MPKRHLAVMHHTFPSSRYVILEAKQQNNDKRCVDCRYWNSLPGLYGECLNPEAYYTPPLIPKREARKTCFCDGCWKPKKPKKKKRRVKKRG